MATDFQKLSKELSGSSGFMGSFLLLVIILLVACLIFWASITELDNVTRGQGKIVSSIQNQIIQFHYWQLDKLIFHHPSHYHHQSQLSHHDYYF